MEISEIKSKLTLHQVLHYYGLKGDIRSRINCPFHSDKTPSMQLYYRTNTAFCFSSNCKTHGKAMDVIDFVMHKENCTKAEAIAKVVAMIQELGNLPIKRFDNEMKSNLFPLGLWLEVAFKKSLGNLKQSEQAQAYCRSRKLDFAKLAIGYQGREAKELKHCIIFPLRDKNNAVAGLYGRSIFNGEVGNKLPAGASRHFYLKESKGLYPSYPSLATTTLIITESIIDCASLLQISNLAAQYSLLACYGTNRLNEEMKQAIKEWATISPLGAGGKEIVFAFDNDSAGKKATIKYAEELRILLQSPLEWGKGDDLPTLNFSTIELPVGIKDVNECLVAHTEEIFNHLLENRKQLNSEIINQLDNEKSIEKATIQPSNIAIFQPLNSSKGKELVPPPTGGLGQNTNNGDALSYSSSELQLSILGGVSLQQLDRLRVTLYVRRNPHLSAVYSIRQTVDLYQHEAVEKFSRHCSERIEVSSVLIKESIAAFTEQLEAYRVHTNNTKQQHKAVVPELSAQEKAVCIAHLSASNLHHTTLKKVISTGIVGEYSNVGIFFYGMTSRLLDSPVSVITLSSSGMGKSYLLENIAACFPSESIIENTHLTDNSLYYFKRDELSHKIMLIEDMDGAQNVEYAIRELISKKYITKTVVQKNSKGQLHTEQYRVEGPVSFFGCTTRESLYEDNANRVLTVYLNNSKAQDTSIMDYHRQVKAGLVNTVAQQAQRKELQQLQRVLEKYKIINPYAPLIELPGSVGKPRRTLGILFSFIEAITLYHQYQPSQSSYKAQGYLQTEPEHIAIAFELLKDTLFRKSDELPAGVRDFMERLKKQLTTTNQVSFYGSDIRKATGIHPRTLRKYLFELKEFGYIQVIGGNKYRKGFEYELSKAAQSENIAISIEKHIQELMQKIHQMAQMASVGTAASVPTEVFENSAV